MKDIYWTLEARTRLQEIQQYLIDQHAEAAAKKLVARLLKRTKQLSIVPKSGHEIEYENQQELRELLEKPYRIIYRITPQQIDIITIKHYHESLPKYLAAIKNS